MNKFKYYFFLLITTVSLFSCSKDEAATLSPPREFAVQYATDLADIEEYLKTYYIEDTNPDVVTKISKIPTGGNQPSIWSYLNSSTFPKLLSRNVLRNGVTYKLYYVVLRAGTGVSPTSSDAVLTAYRGEYLFRNTSAGANTLTATFFEESSNPQTFFNLTSTITGWGQSFPEFKTGTYTSNPDGTVSYSDFGAGILFIPSGLGYYAQGQNSIPAYAPLVFGIKLYEINRLDSDNDGIADYLEDLDGDGYMTNYSNTTTYPTPPADDIRYADDTDKDGIPNFQDTDDDGDGVSTRTEITVNGKLIPFADIPSCDGNTTNPARIKRHLVKCN
ncbi:FKBP-type peptidyl-prolyl cis-trans isomerase [Flavobacterium sp. FPG59]|uniref:FKBP-type peptidyl-prolyl cis-trans isomerase n=1 Tax=Flavobacterium sp. FPG59 TaxID=1929267 RepID=UPI000A3B3ACD|nr:FKBP-type peptidylprolyl isomerase [Flavobacterium sp. FPG59]OUD36113.1 FKBP-type peptidylprolyl isomerase [Flavobacterium sp. FPG59]